MGPNHAYDLLHSKGNHNEKTIHWMGENSTNIVIHTTLISKIYKQLISSVSKH